MDVYYVRTIWPPRRAGVRLQGGAEGDLPTKMSQALWKGGHGACTYVGCVRGTASFSESCLQAG